MSLRTLFSGSLVVLLCAAAGSSLAADKWGTLKGRFVYDGTAPAATPIVPDKDLEVCGKHPLVNESLVVGKDGSLANVIVYLQTKAGETVPVNPEYDKSKDDKVVLDNHNCRFEPHVIGVRVGQTFVIKNSDPMGHNSNVSALFANSAFNPLIPVGGSFDTKFEAPEALPTKVTCNIHGWMQAVLVVRPDPYFAISDKDGKFEIKDLPVGKWEFHAWQEKVGNLTKVTVGGEAKTWAKGRFTLEIKEGANDLGEIKADAKQFDK